MPSCEIKVPLSNEKVPSEFQKSTKPSKESAKLNTDSAKPNGDSTMLNLENREVLNAYIKENIAEIVALIREVITKNDYSHELVMYVTDISKSTFYRIWKIGTPEEEFDPNTKKRYMPTPDTIGRLCLVLGISLTEHDTPPTADSTVTLAGLTEYSHEKIMANMWSEIESLRNTITQLEADRERLETENARLANIAFSREDDIRANLARNNKLSDALLEAHERMHKITEDCNARVDKLLAAILDNK